MPSIGARITGSPTSGLDSVLLATDGHLPNTEGRRGNGAAELEAGPDVGDVADHVTEIAGNGDFGDWVSEFAVLDPESGGAERAIAGDGVAGRSDEFRDIKAIGDGADAVL